MCDSLCVLKASAQGTAFDLAGKIQICRVCRGKLTTIATPRKAPYKADI